MNKEQLWSKVNEFNEENSSVRLQIVHKNKDKNFYKFMDTDIKNKVQKEIFKLVNNSMKSTIRLNELVNFDPISKEDDTIEVIKVDKVSGYKDFKNNRGNTHNYVTGIRDFDTIGFYVLEFNNGESNIKVFRRYSKTKSLSRGIFFTAIDKTLDKIKDTIFQVDEAIDFICINDETIIVFNRYSFELITGYRTNYVENLEKALQEIKESNLINNIDRFCDDCKDSIKIAKRFTKAMANSSISLILANLNDVEPAIKEADLPIKFINNKFEYEGKENLHDLVKLLSDEFAKTLIGKRITG
ncbi:MAG: Kiwa anti-phage protein KwaB-like domain-containing protein [Peptostreptococcaceae bacterium]